MTFNREQRRKFIQEMGRKGVSKGAAEFIIKLKERGFTDEDILYYINHKEPRKDIWEGAKVRLDYRWMKFSPDWNRYNPKFVQWIEDHKDSVLTVEFDSVRREKMPNAKFMTMVCFAEDDTEPKWLFYAGDLILEENQEVPMPVRESPEDKFKFNQMMEKLNQESKVYDAVQEALDREQQGKTDALLKAKS